MIASCPSRLLRCVQTCATNGVLGTAPVTVHRVWPGVSGRSRRRDEQASAVAYETVRRELPPMLRMPTRPRSLGRVLEPFRPCFTTPTFTTFVTLLAGLIAQPANRTVCGMLAGAGLAGVWHHSRAHRFFATARWHPDTVGLTVLRLVVGHLVPVGAPLMSLSGLRFGRSVWVDSGPVGAPPEVDS